jgi:hypothetical protein
MRTILLRTFRSQVAAVFGLVAAVNIAARFLDMLRRIAQERVPTNNFEAGELIFFDCRVVSAASVQESILCHSTKVSKGRAP